MEALVIPNCSLLQNPRKIGIMWQFGFDVDALEIHLHELNDLVDKFFLLESIQPHNQFVISKPLLWDKLKYDKRFVKFSHKIVHFVLDDGDLSHVNTSDIWARENMQEMLRWTKFLEWNNSTSEKFTADDLLGFGDVDEVPYRNNVAFLKYCQLPSDPVDIGIWFPFDGIDTAFKSDYPVLGQPFTLGDPSFWTLGKALVNFSETGDPPNRKRGSSFQYLLGGMHLSRYAYPPFQMIKLLTATESDWGRLGIVIKVGGLFAKGKIAKANSILNTLPAHFRRRTVSMEKFRREYENEAKDVVKVPWYLECNRARFPGFPKIYDSRLE